MTSAWYRVCAHVIVLDERSRILLVSARDPDDDRLVWFAPGGGVEAGVSFADAART